MTAVSATNLPTFAKEFFVLVFFFMFDSREHVYKVIDETSSDKILSILSSKNIAGLGYWEKCFRHLNNSKWPVKTPEDMTGIKMRVPENPVQIAACKSVNAVLLQWLGTNYFLPFSRNCLMARNAQWKILKK